MSVQSTAKLGYNYDIINDTVQGLNKQVRNYNFKTILKIAVYIASIFTLGAGLTLGGLYLAGITTSTIALCTKDIVVASLALVGSYAVLSPMRRAFEILMVKAQNEFLSKINVTLKNLLNNGSVSQEIRAIFGKGIKNAITYLTPDPDFSIKVEYAPNLNSFGNLKVHEINLDSYETVEKRYIEIQQENIQKQNSFLSRWTPSFLKREASA
ncbi:MAG: hypothetical protein KR126chlam4_01302 [Candidatus Anoxychlamydiales bacterium]|nr:hypothetical protein [Candidatus Anoxychlamydiales bacterium]HEU64526.1 hypothetical protein [Chlamydiota bacterium]